MDGAELLQLLLDSRGMTANSLADAVRKRGIQSAMQRYLSGAIKSPRPSTLEPVAKFFGIGVEAFYQPRIAQEIADKLKSGEPPAPLQLRSQDPPQYATTVSGRSFATPRQSVGELAVLLGRALESYDEAARRAVATLLQDLAMHPENAVLTGLRINALLDVPGNEGPLKSSNSG